MASKPPTKTSPVDTTLSIISTHPYDDVTEKKSIDFGSINEILVKVFKHDGFRTELQRDAVIEACKFTRDLFVSLPTGSGKSLIYQLPAIFKNHGLVIVVSPLVALISNQISNAKKLGIPCATINSHMTKTWNTQVKAELKKRDTKLRLLYITPETLCSDHFQPYLHILCKNDALKLFAIDEAHCVSSWGHEFRPDYLKLGHLRISYPRVPIVALTATATEKVLDDIIKVLNLNEPRRIIASTFRKNLFYDVINADDLEESLLRDLTDFILDCLKIKKKVESLSVKKRKLSMSIKSSSDLKRKAAKPNVNVIDSKTLSSTSSSQFVSAATLFAAQALLPPKTSEKKHKKKAETRNIMAPEAPKITSFFKAKPVEVIDLCCDEDDEYEDKDGKDDKHGSCKMSTDMESIVGTKPKTIKQEKTTTESSDDITAAATSTNNNNIVVQKGPGVGIVYCRTKITCEDVSAHLNMKGIPARPYHSGLTSKQRAEIEKLWMDESVLVICATISFGMGIDKANVRVVVHFNMSQSLANYYQESGRAGRDGKEANCRLYYSKSDQSAIAFLLRKDMELETNDDCVDALGPEICKRKQRTARAAMERFEKMVEYCRSNNRCRHLVLAKEFALADESGLLMNGCDQSCDYCLGKKFGSQRPRDDGETWKRRPPQISGAGKRPSGSSAISRLQSRMSALSAARAAGKSSSFVSAALIS